VPPLQNAASPDVRSDGTDSHLQSVCANSTTFRRPRPLRRDGHLDRDCRPAACCRPRVETRHPRHSNACAGSRRQMPALQPARVQSATRTHTASVLDGWPWVHFLSPNDVGGSRAQRPTVRGPRGVTSCTGSVARHVVLLHTRDGGASGRTSSHAGLLPAAALHWRRREGLGISSNCTCVTHGQVSARPPLVVVALRAHTRGGVHRIRRHTRRWCCPECSNSALGMHSVQLRIHKRAHPRAARSCLRHASLKQVELSSD